MDKQAYLLTLLLGLCLSLSVAMATEVEEGSATQSISLSNNQAIPSNEARQILPLENIQKVIRDLKLKVRVKEDWINTFYQGWAKRAVNGELPWVTSQGRLNNSAEALYQKLIGSYEDGLIPHLYHITLIDQLRAKEYLVQQDREALDVVLTIAALSYMRDLSMGRPEIMRVDKDWLLDRRTLEVVPILLDAVTESTVKIVLNEIEPKQVEYQRIKKSLIDYIRKNNGVTTQEPQLSLGGKLAKGDQGARVSELKARLVFLGGLDSKFKDGELFDRTLEDAVKQFQKNHFLDSDGIVGVRTQKALNRSKKDQFKQLIVNMERWRWMPDDLGKHYLVVDLPGFEYYIIDQGKEVMRAKTVVGMAQRSTPVFMARMNHIVFSPYWNVPRSMAIKDKLPHMKKDPQYLARSKIRVLDREGNEIDPTMIDWSRYNTNNFPYRLRQDPGNYNALGKVKFMFPNKHAIYLHDTPQKSLFNRVERTFSSGCIRVENPIELAEYFLKDQGWNKERVTKAYNGTRENTVRLSEAMRIPVYTLYMTINVDKSGNIVYRSDIYDRDELMINAINRLEKM